MKITSRVKKGFLLAVLILALSAGYGLFRTGSAAPQMIIGAEQMQRDENGAYILEGIPLEKGVYLAEAMYAGDGDAYILAGAEEEGSLPVKSVETSFVYLPSYQTYAAFRIYVNHAAGLRLTFSSASGNDDSALQELRLTYRRKWAFFYSMGRALLAICFLACCVFLCGVRLQKRDNRKSVIPIGLFLIWLISCIGFGQDYIPGGHDILFHLIRIAGLAEGISGGIPVRIYPLWWNGYGYPLGVFYPDLLLYLPALLYRAGMPLWKSYVCYACSVNALTVALSYISFRKIAEVHRA